MKKIYSRPRFRSGRSARLHGLNSGHCTICGTSVNWRSVGNRCWRCELDAIRSRQPLHLDRELLLSHSGNDRLPR